MGLKLKAGRLLNKSIDRLAISNFKLLPFIPNGRILPLDLKRANIYPKKIFDVGANIGQTANYFIEHFPESEIFCFEPVLSTYNILKSNVTDKNIRVYHEGLGSVSQEQIINISESSALSTLKNADSRFFDTEIVRINTGQDFCGQHDINSIDLLKIDVEGFELEVLEGFGSMLKSSIKFIYSEVGFDKNDPYKTYISDLLALTNESGFVVSGFYEPYRWGKGKFGVFYNVLLANKAFIDI